jgi:hypothetical protein
MTMVDEDKRASGRDADNLAATDDSSFTLGGDGMSTATARIAISRKLRKRLMADYDLLELENKGRYYAAKAFSKDGPWLNELLIDKQTGSIQVVGRREMSRQEGG